MAGNTRGKLKENLEGVHKNCEWIKHHIEKSLAVLPDGYEQLTESFAALGEINKQLDEFAMALYAGI